MQSAEDPAVLAFAEAEDRVLLSADADFAAILTIGTKRKPSLVLFRGEFEPAAQEQARLLLGCLAQVATALEKGAIVVVTRTRLRIREL
jgi:predicted nuclease of predicted toxin-antitoxin system